MKAEQYIESEETYIFEEINNSIISFPLNGGPMWSTVEQQRFTTAQLMQCNNQESLQVDEATIPMPDPMTPASNYGYDQPNSDNDLNNITPSLVPLDVTLNEARETCRTSAQADEWQPSDSVVAQWNGPEMKFLQTRNKIGPPDRTPNPGPFNFAVMINSANILKKRFLWSHKVRRMYVDAGIDFPLSFNWDEGAPRPAYVRATVVFHDADQSQHRVETCLHHKSSLASKNLPDCQLSNVLHSSREVGASEVYYCGDPGEWYSTVVRYDDNPRTHAYRFICKNSCAGGINRRPIAILFTLENEMGHIFGREEISVRVCACPGRDLKNDEHHAPNGKKPRLADTTPPEPKTKKVKIEPTEGNDDKIVVLPELKVRGVSTALRILELTREFALQHKKLVTDPHTVAEDAAIIADVDAKINELKNTK